MAKLRQTTNANFESSPNTYFFRFIKRNIGSLMGNETTLGKAALRRHYIPLGLSSLLSGN